MKVTLDQHGGFAAGIRRAPRIVDSTSLVGEAAAELIRLVADVQSSRSPETVDAGRARDAMSYTITVKDGGRTTVLKQSDTTMSPAFSALLNWLEHHSEE